MNRFKLLLTLATIVLFFSPNASAGPLETVSLTPGGGGTHQGAGGIQAALTAVDNNGTVRILEAGQYNRFDVNVQKSVKIESTVPNVIVYDGANNAALVDATAGTITLTLSGFRLQSGQATNGSLRVVLSPTNSTSVTLQNMEVISDTIPTGSTNNRAIIIVPHATGNATVGHFTINNSFVQGGNAGGNGVLVNPQGGLWDGLTMNINNSRFVANSETLWTEAHDFQKWTVTNSQIISNTSHGIRVRRAHSNSDFQFTSCTILARNTVFYNAMSDATGADVPRQANSANNTYTFDRCTLDNAVNGLPAGVDRLVRLEFNSPDPQAANAINNKLNFYNCVLVPGFRTDATASRALYNNGRGKITAYHCTIIGGGAAGEAGGNAIFTNAMSDPTDLVNCVIANFAAPVEAASTLGAASGNLIAGPADDSKLGADRVFVTATAGRDAALTAAQIDLNTLIPAIGSPAANIGNTDPAVRTAIGGIDKILKPRPASSPDAGAFESDTPGPPNAARGWVLFD